MRQPFRLLGGFGILPRALPWASMGEPVGLRQWAQAVGWNQACWLGN